jgi:hypothetical protein
LSSSTAVPPAPQATTGPNKASWTTPTSSSTPSADHALDQEPVDRVALVGDRLGHPRGSGPDLPAAGEAELDSAGLGPVEQ